MENECKAKRMSLRMKKIKVHVVICFFTNSSQLSFLNERMRSVWQR